MKHVYFLMSLALVFSTAAFAQRSVDMELTTMYPTGGLVFISANEPLAMQEAASQNNDVSIKLKNLGPDGINDDDTALVGAFNQFLRLPIGMSGIPVGEEFFFNFTDIVLTYEPAGVTSSQMTITQFCDTLWMIDPTGAVIADPDLSNNHNCNNVTINVWYLDVADINKTNGFSMYPNPAATQLNVVSTFNNAKNATVVIRDVVGKTVFTQNLGTDLNGKQTFALDIRNFVTGMYVIELNIDGNRITRQIQVQK